MIAAALAALVVAAATGAAGVKQGTVRTPDGISIAYDVRGQGKTTLVLVHCWACDRTFWREQVEPLSRRYRAKWTVAGLGSPPLSPVTKIGRNRKHGSYDASFMDGVGHYLRLERPAEFNRRLEAAVAEILAAGTSTPRTTKR